MPDSYILTGGGTQVDVATFTTSEPDFGAKSLLSAAFVDGPHTEGVLAHEQAQVRRMVFPLVLGASRSISNLGLEDAEALLRKLARPGATLDLKPDGATTAVRFDVLSGRYEFDYNTFQNRQRIRTGRLELETTPYGYWPTMIILASVGSVGLPGALTWSGPLIGDAPGLAKIALQPIVGSTIAPGSWIPDFVALSISHRASHLSFLQASSFTRLDGASLLGEAVAPGSQSIRYAASQTQSDWKQVTRYTIPSGMEPAYRGRYRAFGWYRIQPSQPYPWYASLDVVPDDAAGVAALGSYAPIATIAPAVASGDPGGYGPQPSAAYTLLDHGEITMPAVGSGAGGAQALRIWMRPGTNDAGIASPVLGIGGLFLMPLDSDFAGVLPRGLAYPSISAPSAARLVLDSEKNQAVLSGRNLDLASTIPWGNAWQHYRGQLPMVASGVRLDLYSGTRKTGISVTSPSYPQIIGSFNPIAYYRMEETVGPTLIDSRGSWHGSWNAVPSLGGPVRIDFGANFDGVDDRGLVASILVGAATSWSVMGWVRRDGGGAINNVLTQGPIGNVGSGVTMQFTAGDVMRFQFRDADALSTADTYTSETEPHLWTFTWDYTSRNRSIWRDKNLVASGQAAGTYVGSGPWNFGTRTDGNTLLDGLMDEVAFFRGTAIGSEIVWQAMAYASPNPAASAALPIVHSAPAFTPASISYRPRFQFIKGL